MLPVGKAITKCRVWSPLALVGLVVLVVLGSLLTPHSWLPSNPWTSTDNDWLAIWETKGVSVKDNEPLHHANGFNGIDIVQFNTLILTIIKSEGRQRFEPNDSVIDFGCGAGAFLEALRLVEGSLRVFGLDYSGPLVEVARRRVAHGAPGHFWRSDVRRAHFLPNQEFDHSVSFGVFMYLETVGDALLAWGEMARVTRVEGSVVVAEVSDQDREEEARLLRSGEGEYERRKKEGQRSSGSTPDHLYIPKAVFYSNAARFGLRIDAILDERDMRPELSFYGPSDYRYTVYATKVAPV